MKSRRVFWHAIFAPVPAKELCNVVRTSQGIFDGGTSECEEHTKQCEDQSPFAEKKRRSLSSSSGKLRFDQKRREIKSSVKDQSDGKQSSQRKPDDDDESVLRDGVWGPPILDTARCIKVRLVRQHDRAQQRDGKICVNEIVTGGLKRWNVRYETRSHCRPVWSEPKRRDDKYQHHETQQPKDPFDRLKGKKPNDKQQKDQSDKCEKKIISAK